MTQKSAVLLGSGELTELAKLATIRAVGFSEINIIPRAGHRSGKPFDYVKAARAAYLLDAMDVFPLIRAAAIHTRHKVVRRIAQEATDALFNSLADTLIGLGEGAQKEVNTLASRMWIATL